MCLFSPQYEPGIADKDITCYKLVDMYSDRREFLSEFFNFEYKLGTEYKEKNFQERNHAGGIDRGFHSYSNLKDVEFELRYHRHRKRLIPSLNVCIQGVVLKCVIPAGARYWFGRNSADSRIAELCSDRIKIVAWKYGNDAEWRETSENTEQQI